MASCVVRDWQGKEAGKATLDLKVAKRPPPLISCIGLFCVSRPMHAKELPAP